MKKGLLLTLLLAVIAISQPLYAQSVYYGPKIGVNISNLNQTTNSFSRTSANIGVLAGYRISNVTSIQTELLYSRQGAKIETPEGKQLLSLNYLKVPILGRVVMARRLRAEAGVSFNLLLSAKNGTNKQTGLNSFDFSIPIGIGYEITRKIEVGVRYDISLVDIKLDNSNTSTNSNWLFSLGYRF